MWKLWRCAGSAPEHGRNQDVSHLELMTDSHLHDLDLSRADTDGVLICMIYLMLKGGSCIMCMVWDMAPGLDVCCTDRAQHMMTAGYCMTGMI